MSSTRGLEHERRQTLGDQACGGSTLGTGPPKEEPRSLGDLLPELSHLPLDSPSGPLKTLLGLLGTS